MENTKILFISQEITPYLPETEMSVISRNLPQGIQEKGKEIRTFMPKYECINERRNQLHEVIRLSGMNLIIDDTDHPLTIKVASIQSARMQVYFIDNEDYFQENNTSKNEKGDYLPDNNERTIFFSRGVLETVKKLRWSPDIVHCHGWITSLVPLYLKKAYKDDPLFCHSKIIYSVYNDCFIRPFNKYFRKKLQIEGITEKDIEVINKPDYLSLSKLAINNSDAAIIGSKNLNSELLELLYNSEKPVLEYQSEDDYIDKYSMFYDKILTGTFNDPI